MMTFQPPGKTVQAARRGLLIAGVAALAGLSACGGGGGGPSDASPGAPPAPPPPAAGGLQTLSLTSQATGSTYSVLTFVPPAAAARVRELPIVYALDGETWFQTLVDLAQAGLPMVVVAVHSGGQRSRDYVPGNTCTPGGGGHERFFEFVRLELLPQIEARIGGDPRQRILFGHSHGGSFVLYALFAQATGQRSFQAYLASDASIGCMSGTVYQWAQAHLGGGAAPPVPPVRLHLSYASLGNAQANAEFASFLTGRAAADLDLRTQLYSGSHSGIVPQALADGLAFAAAPRP